MSFEVHWGLNVPYSGLDPGRSGKVKHSQAQQERHKSSSIVYYYEFTTKTIIVAVVALCCYGVHGESCASSRHWMSLLVVIAAAVESQVQLEVFTGHISV